ncbi:MAG: hypothetical protein K2M64_02800 [Clostridia bacterium]|nr:hypothetical protein [Clostridia bacterium]
MGKKFTCKSEAQKRAIAAYYAEKRKQSDNVSKSIPNGRTLQTRDENFYMQENYNKSGYEDKGNYRRVVVIDSNELNDLAVVKLTTSEKGLTLTYSNGKSKFRPYVLTLDDDGEAIRVGPKFILNSPKKDLSKEDLDKITNEVFTNPQTATENMERIIKLKERK